MGPPSARKRIPITPILLSVAIGTAAGLGGYTFSYAKGLSYLSRDPAACANCHIMQTQYDAWQKSSHHHSAVCIDCHLPEKFLPKYYAKAENGWRHSKLFTTGGFVEPIEIKPEGREILQANCIRCHQGLTADMRAGAEALRPENHATDLPCTHCHAYVGHGPRAALGGPLRAAERSGK